jgi:hypothetical protein
MSVYVVMAGEAGAVVVVVGGGREVVVGVGDVVGVVGVVVGVVVVLLLVVGVETSVVEGVVSSVVGGVLVVDDSLGAVVVVVRNAAVPAVGMAGTSVTCPRTDPTAVPAMVIATRVATLHATTIPTRRIMSALCPICPKSWITDR